MYTKTNGLFRKKCAVEKGVGECYMFNQVSGTKTGSAGLKTGVWNTVEVIFNPANGAFDLYVNGSLYAKCKAPVTGTDFTIPTFRACI